MIVNNNSSGSDHPIEPDSFQEVSKREKKIKKLAITILQEESPVSDPPTFVSSSSDETSSQGSDQLSESFSESSPHENQQNRAYQVSISSTHPISPRSVTVLSSTAQQISQGGDSLQRIGKGRTGGFFVFSDTDREKVLAVFKSSTNQTNIQVRRGIHTNSELVQREAAAFTLGANLGVPPTALIEDETTLIGSAQLFVEGNSCLELAEAGQLEERLDQVPAEDFRRLAFFDLLTGNTDRNLGNLIITPESHFALIDHGCILVPGYQDNMRFCWMDWDAQALHEPLSRDLIESFDIDQHIQDLLTHDPKFPQEAITVLRRNYHFLQQATAAGLTSYQAGLFFEQNRNEFVVSPLSMLVEGAKEKLGREPTEREVIWLMGQAAQEFKKTLDSVDQGSLPRDKLRSLWIQSVKQVITQGI